MARNLEPQFHSLTPNTEENNVIIKNENSEINLLTIFILKKEHFCKYLKISASKSSMKCREMFIFLDFIYLINNV